MHIGNVIKAGCLQLCSQADIATNLNTIKNILKRDLKTEVDLLLLPENVTLLTSDKTRRRNSVQKESLHKVFDFFSTLAVQYQAWIVAGSLLIQNESDANHYNNHCPVFSPNGDLYSSYDKMHLFDADLGSERWCESDFISAGNTPVMISLDEHWKLGLSICYDLRFPELYRDYSKQGCNILTVPAAFTVPTGQAHWETLLRARAIENQSYVLAAGQSGTHQDGRKTYGHSMIIDPWGEILAQIESSEGLITADLELDKLDDIRHRLPALQHRRIK